MRRYSTAAEVDTILAGARSLHDKLSLVLDEDRSLVAANPQRFVDLADSLVGETALDDRILGARFRCNRAGALFKLARYPEAEADLSQAFTVAEQHDDPILLVDCLYTSGLLSLAACKPQDAIATLTRGISLNPDCKRRGVRLRESIGAAHIMRGEYYLALAALDEALAMIREAPVDCTLSSIYSTIGILYGFQEQHDLALEYFDLALRACRAEHNRRAEGKTLINIVASRQAAGSIGTASLSLLDEARAIAAQYKDQDSLGRVALLYSTIYIAEGNLERAEAECATALHIAESAGIPELAFHSRFQNAVIRAESGRWDEAIAAASACIELVQRLGLRRDELNTLKNLSHYHERKGDHEEALCYMKKSFALQFELNSEQTQQTTAQMQARIDLESARHQARLAEAETELARLKAERLATQVERAHGEITAKVLHLSQKNDVLRELQQEVKNALQLEKHDMRLQLRALIRKIANHLDDDRTWTQFEEQFSLLHPGFMQSLAVAYSKLTPTERKVCALIRLQLGSQDICRILGIAARSIESYRYRIRKKMGLQSGEDLDAVLREPLRAEPEPA